MLEPPGCSAKGVKLVPRPQQFWSSWNDVPESVPEEFMNTKFFVEIFAGKAGLSRGVRRRRKIAVLPPIELEVSEDVPFTADIVDEMVRRKLETWIRSGVVQCVHFGTPCTSFSRARRHDGGPPPVRGADSPEDLYGLPGLHGYERDLVDTGNQLMLLTVELVQLCSQCGVDWSVENPASSLLWQMPELLALRQLPGFVEVEFNMCAYGGSSPKPTTIWTSCSRLLELRRSCPGVSASHRHVELKGKVWDNVKKKKVWRTKLAQVYPVDLCELWAQLLEIQDTIDPSVEAALQRWAPSLALVTAPGDRKRAVGSPTKVSEHRQFQTGKKAVAAGYQLKKGVVPPLYLEEPEPGQAIELAVRALHPFSVPLDLPEALERNLERVCQEPEGVLWERLHALIYWHERAVALLPASVEEIQAVPDARMRRLLLGCSDDETPQLGKVTHVALWREMLKACGCKDNQLVEQMLTGFNIVGVITPSGRWGRLPAHKREKFSKRRVKVAVLSKRAWAHRKKVLGHIQKAKITEFTKEIMVSSMEDVEEGSAIGPFHSITQVEEELKKFGRYEDWILTQRFEVVQKNKVRGCDSATVNDVNNTAEVTEQLELPSTDLNVAVLRKMRSKLKKRARIRGWVLDERKAYRQIAIRPDQRKWSVVGFKDAKTGKPVFFIMIGHSFGLVAAVYNYNRRSAAINDILVNLFCMVAFNFYDDKYGFEPEDTVELAKLVAEQVHLYLGAQFDSKKLQLADDPTILGITYDLENMRLLFKESRKKDLIDELKMVRDGGVLSPGHAGKLKGKLMFGASQLWGKVGRAFLRAISHRQYSKDLPKCSSTKVKQGEALNEALEFSVNQWIKLIESGPPREIDDLSPRQSDVVIFTDGYTPDQRKAETAPSRVGGVIFDRSRARPVQFTSEVFEHVIDKWIPRKTQIVMVELVAAVLALTSFGHSLRGKLVLLLIDSEAVEGALIKGYSGAEDVCQLVGLFWDLAATLKCSIYIDRVPTDANPADYPSRNDLLKGREAGWETAEISWPDELV